MALMVGWSAYVRYDIAMEMVDRRAEAEQQAAVLQERLNDLQAEVEYLSNDRGIEAEMRRQFDVSLPGEQVVVIVEDEDDGPVVEPLATTTPQKHKRWYQFWR
ncbi:MAG: septum formation initiator family protein [Candidatus Kaiserbacteria bacterium]|nr:septum formation initiator family protein [Candidatus Kaiserbacteria bacterium]